MKFHILIKVILAILKKTKPVQVAYSLEFTSKVHC